MWTIEVDQVSKAFASDRGRVVTADGLTLTAAAGEITAVIGESGCGKTTLLRMIAGLETPDSGSIRFTNPEKPDTAPRISVVFQEPRLFPWMTVRENVSLAVRELPGSEKWGRTDEALKAVRLCDAADAFPKELSGGMRAGWVRAPRSRSRLTYCCSTKPLGHLTRSPAPCSIRSSRRCRASAG